MNKLPPLNGLKTFETTARLGNITRAAEELRVSQSAVSRQIRLLEAFLDVRLFRREARGVALTKAGIAYQKEISQAFSTILQATDKIRRPSQERTLRVRAYTTFAVKWLLNHLPNFEAAYPMIKVQLSTGVEKVNFEREDLDISIEFSMDNKLDRPGIKLFPDLIEPVCAPSLLKSGKSPTLSDLTKFKLLDSHYRTADWRDWLRFAGIDTFDYQHNRLMLPNSLLAYEAAINGQGIAMGQPHLLAQDLKAGRLITPFNMPLSRAGAYYLMISPGRTKRLEVRRFSNWIVAEATGIG